MARPSKYSPELRRRAIAEVIERGRKIPEVAREVGFGSPETLRNWVKQARRDAGLEVGPSTKDLAEIRKAAQGGGRPAAHDRNPEDGHHVFRSGGRPPIAVTVAFIDANRDRWPVAAMCRTLDLAERSYQQPSSGTELATRATWPSPTKPDCIRPGVAQSSSRGFRWRRQVPVRCR